MTTAFQRSLEDIKKDEHALDTYNEREIEYYVIVPLLESLGWKSKDPNQVAYQADTTDGRVDFSLKTSGESQVFIEAKQWESDLAVHEGQLHRYLRRRNTSTNACRTSKWSPLASLPSSAEISIEIPPQTLP